MVFFNHYYLLTRLLSFTCQEALSVSITTRGAKCLCTLCSYQEVSLCLVSQVMLRSSTFASSIVCFAKSHLRSTTPHTCLSQAYGCSDRYTDGPQDTRASQAMRRQTRRPKRWRRERHQIQKVCPKRSGSNSNAVSQQHYRRKVQREKQYGDENGQAHPDTLSTSTSIPRSLPVNLSN